jgi:hypothetical protein
MEKGIGPIGEEGILEPMALSLAGLANVEPIYRGCKRAPKSIEEGTEDISR